MTVQDSHHTHESISVCTRTRASTYNYTHTHKEPALHSTGQSPNLGIVTGGVQSTLLLVLCILLLRLFAHLGLAMHLVGLVFHGWQSVLTPQYSERSLCPSMPALLWIHHTSVETQRPRAHANRGSCTHTLEPHAETDTMGVMTQASAHTHKNILRERERTKEHSCVRACVTQAGTEREEQRQHTHMCTQRGTPAFPSGACIASLSPAMSELTWVRGVNIPSAESRHCNAHPKGGETKRSRERKKKKWRPAAAAARSCRTGM